jgi:hypothetical protein
MASLFIDISNVSKCLFQLGNLGRCFSFSSFQPFESQVSRHKCLTDSFDRDYLEEVLSV